MDKISFMSNYYGFFFGLLWTSFSFFVLSYTIEQSNYFSTNNINGKTKGIIDSTYYYVGGVGGGSSYTIRVKYYVNQKEYFVSPQVEFYFEFEDLLGKEVSVIYNIRNPEISIIDTFRERKLSLIGSILFLLFGILITLNSNGYKIVSAFFKKQIYGNYVLIVLDSLQLVLVLA